MPSSSSSPRVGAMVSLVGVALLILGFCLPMFTQSNPQVPGSAHPVYEWQVVNDDPSSVGLTALLGFLAALPLVSMLVVFGTSIEALYRIHTPDHYVHAPRIVSLRGAAAVWGLAIQLLFNVFTFQLLSIGYARTDIGWGFVVILMGFIVMVIGAFVVKSHQRHE
ncbi:MAG: hypothetical protein NVSMB49_18960 [Ktedonobacteraceae bacterium]